MIEKLKLLLQQQMDNVLERIDENEESKSEGGEDREEEESNPEQPVQGAIEQV
jgi:hypothetical protein